MKLLESGRGKGGGLKLNHSDMSIQRCICGKEYRQTSYHYPTGYCSATCKRQDKTHVLRCQWCGRGFVSKITQMRKVCSKRCASRTGAWGSRGAFEEAQRMAIECLTEKGMSRKATWTEMQTDTNALRKLVCYIWGPNAWDYFGEIRKRHNAAGFKGARTRPLNVSEQMAIKGSVRRNETAKALRVWRLTGSTQDAGVSVGRPGNSGSSVLHRSKVYKRISQRRIKESRWRKREEHLGYRQAGGVKESDIRDSIARDLQSWGFLIETEVDVPDWTRCDLLAIRGDFAFAIEIKANSRKSRMAACLGQALVSAQQLDATPVMCNPMDVSFPTALVEAAGNSGCLATTEYSIARDLLSFCSLVKTA